jgi:hypothetical protein
VSDFAVLAAPAVLLPTVPLPVLLVVGTQGNSMLVLKSASVTWMPLMELEQELTERQCSGQPLLWWGFSSTSTSMPAVKKFLGDSGPRVIFTIDGGSVARDIRRYHLRNRSMAIEILD